MGGAISHNQKWKLVIVQGNLTAQRYIKDVLQPHLLPVLIDRDSFFQHDNARPHTAHATVNFLQNSNVNVLPWPSKSPNLNPIEHLWDILDRRGVIEARGAHTRYWGKRPLVTNWSLIDDIWFEHDFISYEFAKYQTQVFTNKEAMLSQILEIKL